ncbi:DUF5701 family protein [Nesterenkonia haasae]|uniref:DUF5701 family protein n=1 Tax=Nesterenkonia haasae TaxID=2587813 RepID=UPI00139173C2|nr:DUF5701 family protein [Nesterenkonia haasae]NDK30890.1 hypothetical protein [Nesterenkonia haasae]
MGLDSVTTTLPSLSDQAERLITLGLVHESIGGLVADDELRSAAIQLEERLPEGSLLVVAERLLPPSRLVPHLRTPKFGSSTEQREGFVVADMSDIDDFAPTMAAEIPEAAIYAITAPDRGDDMRNWSPAEAEAALRDQERTPLTLAEGIHLALQAPEMLVRGACYMTIGSRLRKAEGFDARTPALWISNGTGRDGRQRRGAPKAGWCWWNNRHTWLGFASGDARLGLGHLIPR